MSADTSWLRPSALPKLAICGEYRGDPKPSKAAERGTRMDRIFRTWITGECIATNLFDADELEAVRWAVDTARALAGGETLESGEEWLKVEALGLSGTMDLVCWRGNWHADLKSGQVRDYEAQMALYALGCMERFFVDEWTAYLLFCDQRELVTLRFTMESAEKIARAAIANAMSPGPPVLSEYCAWCAVRTSCQRFLESVGIVEFDGPKSTPLEQHTSEVLRDIILREKRVAMLAADIRTQLYSRYVAGERTPGVTVSNRKGKDGEAGYSVVSVRYPKEAK